MTDFLFQDLKNLTNEKLVLILSNEKRQMFGEPRVIVKRRAVHRLAFSFFAGSFSRLRKAGAGNDAK
jgi:hypothetical protein